MAVATAASTSGSISGSATLVPVFSGACVTVVASAETFERRREGST